MAYEAMFATETIAYQIAALVNTKTPPIKDRTETDDLVLNRCSSFLLDEDQRIISIS
jgi:hypothetical protein